MIPLRTDDLNGTGTATQGDWVTGTTYPIIDNGGSIFDAYSGAYYPPFTQYAQPCIDRVWPGERRRPRSHLLSQRLCSSIAAKRRSVVELHGWNDGLPW